MDSSEPAYLGSMHLFSSSVRWARLRLAITVAATLLLIAVRAATAAAAQPVPVPVTVGSAGVGPKVPAGFVGLATEYWDLEKLEGNNPSHPDQAFEQTLENLSPYGSLSLRIGGDSTDWVWWPIAGMKKPPWVRWTVTPQWAAVTKKLAQDVDAKLILGINLEADNRRVSAHELDELKSHIGLSRIKAFEVGNEPELYSKYPFYHEHNQVVHGRPKTYQGPEIAEDWDWMVGGLTGHVPLAGPGFVSFNALPDVAPLLSSTKRVSLLTVHSYALKSTRCDGDHLLQEDELFQPSSLQALADEAQSWTHAASRYRVPIRIDEMNSVTCGGLANYSDSFGPALWALNILPMYEQAGITGVNFDTVPGTLQDLIQAQHTSSGWNVWVQPEYYGLITFAQLTPPGSRMLPVSAMPDGMYAWAVRTPSHETNVVVTNVSNSKKVVSLKAAGVTGEATVSRLIAPGGLKATSGVTLGGQSISTSTGRLTGTPVSTSVTASGGHYSVTVPGGSAAIVSFG